LQGWSCDSGFLLLGFVCRLKWCCDVEVVVLQMGMLQEFKWDVAGLKWRMSFLCIVDANYIRMNKQRRIGG